jgi:hypothetical protein
MSERLRVFISSPGDVQEERLRANLIVQKLARDYARFFRIEAYLWEYEPMLASGHFQDAIEPPSASDVVVLIVYSRLGTFLPEHSTGREYRGLDGRAPVTGTEWEFEEALQANRARGAPDLLAYRKVGDPGASLADAARRAEQERQWGALEAFWRRHFEAGSLFLAGSSKFRTLDEFDRKLEADLVTLIERRIAAGLETDRNAADVVWFKGSPFRGLASYDFDDAPIFFGRDAQTRTALTRLQGAAANGSPFLLILGASGSGKSSLARAGILPALFAPKAISGVAVWRRVVLRPGEGEEDPVLGLARALVAGDAARGVGLPELLATDGDPRQLAAHLATAADDPSYPFRAALDRVVAAERARNALLPHETARLVLLVDQMEDLFTRRIDPARRELFVRILAGLARSGLVWVVGTMRNDLWHRAVEIPQLVALVEASARLDLLRPDAAQVIEIVRRPATAAGLAFETDNESSVGLDAVIARAAAEEPGVLPLLSVMLDALYERDIAGAAGEGKTRRVLRFATYRELGELKGAIARRADEVLVAVGAADPEAAASFPRLLRALVTTAADGKTVTTRPARLGQFPEGSPEARLISAMLASDARLLVASSSEGGAEIRLAHEALVDKWPKAHDLIELDRRDLETRTRLEALQRRWQHGGQGDRTSALLTGLNLAEGLDLVRRWNIDGVSELGAFVRVSERADAWRRRRLLVAAAAIVCVFAGIAAVAGLQWRRAENQAEVARAAEVTEKSARSAAEAERARAAENEKRAEAALRDTQLETARTLAAQVQMALGANDVRQALALALKAGNIEKAALLPGDTAASEPALLQSLAEAREVLHIEGASQSWWMPYAFFGDATLAYADAKAGLVLVDLSAAPKITKRVALPAGRPVTQLAILPEGKLAAVAAGSDLTIVDVAAGKIVSTIALPDRINALDIDPGSRRAVVGTGKWIGIVDLDRPVAPTLIAVPEARDGVNVGQVRFAMGGSAVLATYGVKVLEYDLARQAFFADVGELSGAGIGADNATLESVIAAGQVAFVRIVPDLDNARRFFTVAPLELQAIDPVEGTKAIKRDDSDSEFRGMATIDQERSGKPTAKVAVVSRTGVDRQQFELRYVSGSDGLLLTKEGGLYPPLESFAVPPGDMANQKPDSCTVSVNVSYLACQYWTKDLQGIVVWRVLGGKHRFERIAARYNASSGVSVGDGVILSADKSLVYLADGVETKLADLPDGWRLTSVDGPYVIAQSPAAGEGQIFHYDGAGKLTPMLGPISAASISIVPGGAQALVQKPASVELVELADGKLVWSVPIGALRAVGAASDGRRAIAVAANAVYLIDTDVGRILTSFPLAVGDGTPVAVDPDGGKVAYLDAGHAVAILDLTSGRSETIATKALPTRFAWTKDSSLLLVGGEDGSVLAWDVAGKARRWLVPTPFEKSFQATAWPGQPPQGTVLNIALSHDGRRFALLRQDMPSVELHDMKDGRYLTELTPPWSTLKVPADVSFSADDTILTAWAVHAMARDKPNFVTVHRVPRDFDEALAAVTTRLQALNAKWSAEGPSPEPAN